MNPNLVACITDFGIQDSYVAEMKGVMLGINPGVRIVDITHNVPFGDVAAGAYLLNRAQRWFPDGAVFLAVVDPGVGTDRQAVAVSSGGKYYIAPDNDLLSRAIRWDSDLQVRIISQPGKSEMGAKLEPQISATFHGRDLFAPAAARLAGGELFDNLGVPGKLKDTRPPVQPVRESKWLVGHIIYLDRFGNAATDIPNQSSGDVDVMGERLRWAKTYAQMEADKACWMQGSDGCIELAAQGRSAADILGLMVGCEVRFRVAQEDGSPHPSK